MLLSAWQHPAENIGPAVALQVAASYGYARPKHMQQVPTARLLVATIGTMIGRLVYTAATVQWVLASAAHQAGVLQE